MSDEQQFLMEQEMERERREQSVILRLEDEYTERGAQAITDERIRAIEQSHGQSLEQLRAQRIRLGIQQDQPQVQVNAPLQAQAEPLPDDYVNLTAKQRKKLDSRRKDGLKKARRRNIPGASMETLPMMEQVRQYNRQREEGTAVIDLQGKSWREFGEFYRFDANIFSKPYIEGRDTTLDVAAVRTQIERLNLAIGNARMQQPPELLDVARFNVLERIKNQMEAALKTVMASNGVNYLTGEPVTAEEQQLAAQNKEAAVEAYRHAAGRRLNAMADEFGVVAHDEIERHVRDYEQLQKEAYREESENLPFTFAYYEAADNYKKLRATLDANPDTYREHKGVIDRMFAEYLDIEKEINESTRRGAALMEMGTDLIISILQDRAVDRTRMDTIAERADTLYTIMRHLLTGRALESPLEHEVLANEFGIETEQVRERRQALEQLELMERQNAEMEAMQQTSLLEHELPLEQLKREGLSPLATDKTVELYGRIKPYSDRRANSAKDFAALTQAPEAHGNPRVLRALARGYSINGEGQPLVVEDEASKTYDRQLYEHYLTGNAELRRPYLENMVQRVLAFTPNDDMLEPANLEGNLESVMEMVELVSARSAMAEDNPEFFRDMPTDVQVRFNARCAQLSALGAQLAGVLKSHAINYPMLRSMPLFMTEATARISEDELRLLKGAVSKAVADEKLMDDTMGVYRQRHEGCRQRTPQEKGELARHYKDIYAGRTALRNRLTDAALDGIAISAAQRQSFLSSGEYDRLRLRLDVGLSDETNIQRMRSEVAYYLFDYVTGEERINTYNELKEGIKSEVYNVFNYIDWLELTEEQILERADEIVRTEMSLMHISDMMKTTNPVTGKRLRDELLTPEQSEMFSVLSVTLTSYKSRIRGTALELSDSELHEHMDRYLIALPRPHELPELPPNHVRMQLIREYSKSDSTAKGAAAFPMYRTLIARRQSGEPTVLPEGMPQPLYRAQQ